MCKGVERGTAQRSSETEREGRQWGRSSPRGGRRRALGEIARRKELEFVGGEEEMPERREPEHR
jgi:hypothetical protein